MGSTENKHLPIDLYSSRHRLLRMDRDRHWFQGIALHRDLFILQSFEGNHR